MHDVIIVGTGPAGVAAALGLSDRGVKPLILDVGHSKLPRSPLIQENFLEYRKQHDCFDLLIGKDFHGLVNLGAKKLLPLKLTAPYLEYVIKDAPRLSPIEETDFNAAQSFAGGGLSNAWSAGLYLYNDGDLEGFPIKAKDLEPHYNQLMKEFDVRGEADDLTPFFGSTEKLISPFKLSANLKKLNQGYWRKRKISNRAGLYLGQPRVGVVPGSNGRSGEYEDSNLELWQGLPNIYFPLVTLNKLNRQQKIAYHKNILVQSWSERSDGIWVEGIQADTEQPVRFKGKKLVLAAGAINTAKIVLKSHADFHTELPILDNPTIQIPFILPSSIGSPLESDASGLVRLNLIWVSASYGCMIQGTIMELCSVMRAEFFPRMPFSARGNLSLIRYLAPAMLGMQLFFPASVQKAPLLKLKKDHHLRIKGSPNSIDITKIKNLLLHFRKWGAWSHIRLVERVPLGSSIHYAGTLPMRHSPKTRYECDRFGKLFGTQNVYVADAACFPELPAKNMSFAMMANAMRIMDHVAEELE